MPETFPFNKTYRLLEKSLNVSTRRHSLISGNIANVNTLGYQPKDLDFQKALDRELNNEQDSLYRTHKNHFKHAVDMDKAGTLRERREDEYNLDAVNIDTEMSNLLENSIKYRTNVEMLLRKIQGLRDAIQEGGR